MSRPFAYLIGEPGVGKSTVAAQLTCNLAGVEERLPNLTVTHWYGDGPQLVVTELGWRKPGFPGTDTLSMSVLPTASDWIRNNSHLPAVFGEGDRLGHPKFWAAAQEAGFHVTVFVLVDPVGAATRRANRSVELNAPPQSESWVKGRQTRIRNLTEQWPCHELRADWLDTEQLADALMDALL